MLVTLAASCTSSGGRPPARVAETAGGTLRVGLLAGDGTIGWCPLLLCGKTFDPQSTSFVDVFELDRCCLMRTLLSYNGSSVADGGTVLRPDMARSLPTISSDGLTWTFHLRSGVHYAPPFEHTEIVAADFIRSIERCFTRASTAIPWSNGGTIGGYWTDTYLANVIAGAHEFTEGKADHVSGLQAPDSHTLIVHLTEPVGDLGYRLALPQLGPIPANPAHPSDPLGVAQGHDFDYGDVMVSSGPYMFQGSDKLSYTSPPKDQLPPLGNGFDTATLVRNPSWSPASDPVRKAYPDGIEFFRLDSAKQAEQLVRSGALDVVLDWATGASTTMRWLNDPALRSQIQVTPADGERYLFLNLAVAPFHDVHVRRAMNLVLDRQAIARALELRGSEAGQQVFTHLALDSYEDNLLLSYSPPGLTPSGDLAAARQEMRRSRYDENHDGRCDASVCSGIRLVTRRADPSLVRGAQVIASELRAIGLNVRVEKLSDDAFNGTYGNPSARIALRMDNWFKDFPSASTFFPVLLGSENIGGTNAAMTGATAVQLRRYGYSVQSVPNVDGRIAACEALVYEAQTQCWAQLDQYLSEQVVPWIPLTQQVEGWLFSSRVRGFTVDASDAIPLPALDQIQVSGAPPAPPPITPSPLPVPSIPDGVYRVTVSLGDIVRAGGAKDDHEDTGTFTVVLRHGRFMWHQLGRYPIFNPIAVGTYEGTGSRVRFHVDEPYYNAVDLSALTWRQDGDSLVFSLPRCTGPAAKDPAFCGAQKALFVAHPWQQVAEVSGGA
jgi:peptide/nickel transport system substrate-binding protein